MPDDSWRPAIGRTRNPDRIPVILEAIRKEWEKSPDLRLCQLLNNVLRDSVTHSPELARVEDYKLFELIVVKNNLATCLPHASLLKNLNLKEKHE